MHKNLQEELDEAQREIEEMQRHLDRMTGLIHSIGRTGNLQIMQILYKFYQDERRDMHTRAIRVNEKLINLKEVKVKGKERTIVGLLIVVMTFLLIISVVGAQDATTPLAPINTPQVIEGVATPISSTIVPVDDLAAVLDALPTEEVPVIVVNTNPDRQDAEEDATTTRIMTIAGFLIFLLYSGIKEYFETRKTESLVNTVNKGLDNKLIMDEARERYMQGSMENKEFINLLGAVFRVVGNFNIPGIDPAVDKAADWIDNLTNPQPPPPSGPTEMPTIAEPDLFRQQYSGDLGASSTP